MMFINSRAALQRHESDGKENFTNFARISGFHINKYLICIFSAPTFSNKQKTISKFLLQHIE